MATLADRRTGTYGLSTMRTLTPDEINDAVDRAFPGRRFACSEVGPDYAVARQDVEPDMLRPGGFVAGAVQFGIADEVLWYATFAVIGEIELMAMTSELSIRYLRPATGSVLSARARIHAAGRRNVVGSVTIWTDQNEDRPSAVAQGTYVRPAAGEAPGGAAQRQADVLSSDTLP